MAAEFAAAAQADRRGGTQDAADTRDVTHRRDLGEDGAGDEGAPEDAALAALSDAEFARRMEQELAALAASDPSGSDDTGAGPPEFMAGMTVEEVQELFQQTRLAATQEMDGGAPSTADRAAGEPEHVPGSDAAERAAFLKELDEIYGPPAPRGKAARAAAAAGGAVQEQIRFRLGKLPHQDRRSRQAQGARGSQRQRQVAAGIERALREGLFRQNLVPGLADAELTIAEVSISPSLRHARVHWEPTGDAARDAELELLLEQHHGKLRHYVARKLNIKYAPELAFAKSKTSGRQAELNSLFRAIQSDLE